MTPEELKALAGKIKNSEFFETSIEGECYLDWDDTFRLDSMPPLDDEFPNACFDLLDRMEAAGFGTRFEGSSELKVAQCFCLIPVTPVSQDRHVGKTRTEAIVRLFNAVMPDVPK